MIRTSIVLAALVAAAPAAHARQARVTDRVIPKKGSSVEGTIQRETYKDVTIQLSRGGNTTFAASDIARIEYGDAPASFAQAMVDIEGGSFEDALAKINSAESSVNNKEVKPIPRAWFSAWVSFYRGLCLREIGREKGDRLGDAIRELTRHIDTYKDSRFLADAYELVLECYGEKDDSAGADEFIKKIAQAPTEIRGTLQKKAQKFQAEALLARKQYDQAKASFEILARDADADIAADGAGGVIRTLQASGKGDQLRTYCKQVLAISAGRPVLLLLASNALADSLFSEKKFSDAARQYADSVVRYHPGRGAPQLRDHERALYQLARCYEALADAAKSEDAKRSYQIMAGRTYRELAMTYPSGRHAEEANAKAGSLDK